jgi:hypothetical protein
MKVTQTLHTARATQQQRFPTAGKIRPGIKVLTQKAAALTGARDIYDAMLAQNASFDAIEKELKAKVKGCPAYPLTPRNAEAFRVLPGDFTAPGMAEAIMAHADEDGKLRSFPIVFPSDDIDLVFREGFEAWKRSELMFWSEPDPQTGVLMCKRRQDAGQDRSRRRRWGGRPVETVRSCDPNACDVFDNGDCKHNATLYFYVPGCSGVGLIEMSFTSVYASMGITEVLETVRAGLGRIKGTINGKAIFWISKSLKEVARMDWQSGKASRANQWIINIEARGLDMPAILSAQETTLALPPADIDETARALPTPMPQADPVAEQDDSIVAEQTRQVADPDAEATPAISIGDLRKAVNSLIKSLGINIELFSQFMGKTHGPDWGRHEESLQEALQTLEHAAETGDISAFMPPPVAEHEQQDAPF